MVRSLGADHVIDYTREDFTLGTQRYDLIFDVASNLTLSSCRRVLTTTGTYVLIGHDHYGEARGRVFGSVPRALGLMALSPFFRSLAAPNWAMPIQSEAMATLKRFLEGGQLTPIVDSTLPLSQAAKAIGYLEQGHAQGKVVIVP